MIIINHLLFSNAIELLNNLGKYEGYIVGGYARDKYLNKASNDIDICTNASSEYIESNFNILEKNSFGGYLIEYKGNNYELTRFRKDIYSKNRFPDVEFINDLKTDLYRRDFTINTLCIDKFGNYIDLMEAKEAIDNKVIECVINNNWSFEQDPLRIIRAIRFKVDLDFNYSDSLYKAIIDNKNLLRTISKKRIRKEIGKVKNKKDFLNEVNILDLKDYIK